jgi:hypothetical protein
LEDLFNDYNPNLGNVGVHDRPFNDPELYWLLNGAFDDAFEAL